MKTVYLENLQSVTPAGIIFMAALSELHGVTQIRMLPRGEKGTFVKVPQYDFVLDSHGLIIESQGNLFGKVDDPYALNKIDPDNLYDVVFGYRHGLYRRENGIIGAFALLELSKMGLDGIRLAVALVRVLYKQYPELMAHSFRHGARHADVVTGFTDDETELLQKLLDAQVGISRV